MQSDADRHRFSIVKRSLGAPKRRPSRKIKQNRLPHVHRPRASRTVRLETTIPAELLFANQPPAKEGKRSKSQSRYRGRVIRRRRKRDFARMIHKTDQRSIDSRSPIPVPSTLQNHLLKTKAAGNFWSNAVSHCGFSVKLCCVQSHAWIASLSQLQTASIIDHPMLNARSTRLFIEPIRANA